MLSADLNLLSSPDVQQEVGSLLSCKMTKVDFVYLEGNRKLTSVIFYLTGSDVKPVHIVTQIGDAQYNFTS